MKQPAKKELVPYRYSLDELPFDITHRELLYFFSMDKEDRAFINERAKLKMSRIVLGIHIGAFRFIGRSQIYPEKTPPAIVKFVADELGILMDGSFSLTYSGRERTRREHIQITRIFLGLKSFSFEDHTLLDNHLHGQSLDPGHLPHWIKEAEDFLRKSLFVLPTSKVLRRLILTTRYKSIEIVMNRINELIGDERRNQLDTLLQDQTEVETLWNALVNKNIYTASPEKVHAVLRNVNIIRGFHLNDLGFNTLPVQHLQYFAAQGSHLTAKKLRDFGPSHRYAIMAATLRELEGELIDIAIQMNDEIITGVFQRGENRTEIQLRKNQKLVRQVLTAFRWISDTLLDESLQAEDVVLRIKEKLPNEQLQLLKSGADLLDTPRSHEVLRLAARGYQTIQKYLPEFISTLSITSSSQQDPIIEAANYYVSRQQQKKGGIDKDAPKDFILEKRWKQVVFDEEGKPKTTAWVLCLADQLRRSFRQGSLQVEGTRQYKSLRADFIPWTEWNSIKIKENPELPYTLSAQQAIAPVGLAIQALSGQFKQWIKEEHPSAVLDNSNNIHLTKLDSVAEPDSAKTLRRIIQDRMPNTSLSEILVETDKLASYSQNFTRLSSGQFIQQDEKSHGQALYAVLLASACNIPLSKIAISPGISLSVLETIREETLRPQTLRAATAALVNFYSRLPLSQIWGSGETSSSDGQGFSAAGQPLGSAYNPHRFRKRGFMIYTHLADNYAPYYTQLIGSAYEATHTLDGLMYHGSILLPREHYTDSHGFTDIVFTFAYMLGFRLAPRIANIPDRTLWYSDDYPVDSPELFNNKVFQRNISGQWESMQRMAHTVYSGTTRASQIIRKISAFSRKHPLFKATRDMGRLLHTRHIFELAGDKDFRRNILQGLNKGESKNSLARDIRYARLGSIRERDPEMQLNIASSLNFVVLCVAVWNTVHMQRIIRSLLREGYPVTQEDLAFLSPYAHEHINLYGQFRFQPIPKPDPLSVEKEFQSLW